MLELLRGQLDPAWHHRQRIRGMYGASCNLAQHE